MEEQGNIKSEGSDMPTGMPMSAQAQQDVQANDGRADKPKKKANVPAIILGILVFILAGAATFFGLDYFGIIGEKDSEVETETEVVDVESVPEEIVVEVATSTMAEEYAEVQAMIESLTGSTGYVDVFSLEYKPEGMNTYVPIRFALSRAVLEDDLNGLKSKLTNAGFTVFELPSYGPAVPVRDEYLNSSKDIICGIISNVLSCAKTSWVWLTDANKTLVNELSEAYREKTGEYPKLISLGGAIKSSQYEPYQTLSAGLSGAVGEFYRVSPESEWQFFGAYQGVPNCGDYDTEDLKKAYLGDICWDNGDSEVKL